MHEHKAIKVMLGIMARIADRIRQQGEADPEDIDKIVDFLKTFADKCHHGKEETVLFPALLDAGLPKQGGPIGVMLHEHELGRGFIRDMSEEVNAMRKADQPAYNRTADAMLQYVNLLTNHIQKEDNVLFPMADKLLSSDRQEEIFQEFERIEEEVVGHGVHEQYHELLKQLKEKYSD